MSRRILCIAVIVATLMAPPAQAHDIPVNTGTGLLANCTIRDDDQSEVEHHVGVCLGFIKGVGNTWVLNNPTAWCLPANFENKALIDAVVSRLQLLPKSLRDEPSAPLIVSAIEAAYHCPKR